MNTREVIGLVFVVALGVVLAESLYLVNGLCELRRQSSHDAAKLYEATGKLPHVVHIQPSVN